MDGGWHPILQNKLTRHLIGLLFHRFFYFYIQSRQEMFLNPVVGKAVPPIANNPLAMEEALQESGPVHPYPQFQVYFFVFSFTWWLMSALLLLPAGAGGLKRHFTGPILSGHDHCAPGWLTKWGNICIYVYLVFSEEDNNIRPIRSAPTRPPGTNSLLILLIKEPVLYMKLELNDLSYFLTVSYFTLKYYFQSKLK